MAQIYYLDNCTTCKKVIQEAGIDSRFVFQNLKQTPISPEQLDWLYQRVGSYAKLFNKQSRKYKELGLASQNLTEDDYRAWILKEYTFLKRPIVVFDEKVFICRDNATVQQLRNQLTR